MVSKIIPTHDINYSNELRISQILKKIDSGKKYYLTFEKYCYINSIPEERHDFVKVHYINDDFT